MKFFTALAALTLTSTALVGYGSSVSLDPVPSSVAVASTVDPEIEKMKQCARDAKTARMRWFFEETGLTTTVDSGAAQSYDNQMKAMGISTKTPIPTPICG